MGPDTGLALMVSRQYRLSGMSSGVSSAKNSWTLDLLFAHRFTGRTIFSTKFGVQFNKYPKGLDLWLLSGGIRVSTNALAGGRAPV